MTERSEAIGVEDTSLLKVLSKELVPRSGRQALVSAFQAAPARQRPNQLWHAVRQQLGENLHDRLLAGAA